MNSVRGFFGNSTCEIWKGCMLSRFSRIWLFATQWTVACKAPLSVGFSRQKYWSGLPFLSPGDLPNPGLNPCFLRLLHWFFTPSTTWEETWKEQEAGFEHGRPSDGYANLKSSRSIQQEVLGQKLFLKVFLAWAETSVTQCSCLAPIIGCGLSRKSLALVWKLRQIQEVLKEILLNSASLNQISETEFWVK